MEIKLISVSILEMLSIFSSMASLILAIIAIWLALHQKKETDLVNKETQKLLLDVKTDAGIISQIAMPELKAYGDTMRSFFFKFIDLNGNGSVNGVNGVNDILDEIVGSLDNGVDSVREKINQLRKTKKTKSQDVSHNVIEKLKTNDEFALDIRSLNKGVVSVPYLNYASFQDLLNAIYTGFLKGTVSVFSYGVEWELRELTTQQVLMKKTEQNLGRDKRKLADVGIVPGQVYKVVLLKN